MCLALCYHTSCSSKVVIKKHKSQGILFLKKKKNITNVCKQIAYCDIYFHLQFVREYAIFFPSYLKKEGEKTALNFSNIWHILVYN